MHSRWTRTLLICATMIVGPFTRTFADAQVAVWLTTGDQTHLLDRMPDRAFDATEDANVTVDPGQQYQEIVGFGAALTDASALNIRDSLSPEARNALMGELFGPGPDAENFSFLRLTMGAADFSPYHYTYDDTFLNQPDESLSGFSLDPIRDTTLPLIRQALAINPALKILGSPFSAPAWMKTNQSLNGGQLEYRYYVAYANYFIRYLDEMAAEGVHVDYFTIQNEPLFEPFNYPGMRWDGPDRASFIANDLGPRLAQRQNPPGILDFDHNWDLGYSAEQVLARADAYPFVQGVGWHCYGGDVTAQGALRDRYPDKDVFFTECSGGAFAPNWSDNLQFVMRQLIIGGMRNWSRGVLMWNLALNENYGPHLGGCPNCTGIVTINSQTGQIIRNVEYYGFGHASRFVRQGARRIESTYRANGLETVAFRNPDGSFALLAVNGETDERALVVETPQGRFAYPMPGRSTATFTWAQ